MNKFSNIKTVNLGVEEVKTELIFLTENNNQAGSLIVIYQDDTASVYSVAVLSKHRGKGYGKKLMEKAINRCREKGCKVVRLNTETDNTVANNLYQSMGFKINEVADNFNCYSLSL